MFTFFHIAGHGSMLMLLAKRDEVTLVNLGMRNLLTFYQLFLRGHNQREKNSILMTKRDEVGQHHGVV